VANVRASSINCTTSSGLRTTGSFFGRLDRPMSSNSGSRLFSVFLKKKRRAAMRFWTLGIDKLSRQSSRYWMGVCRPISATVFRPR
jgi:hypothetical protein